MENLNEEETRQYLDYIIRESKVNKPLGDALKQFFETEDISILDEAAQRNSCLSIYTWRKSKLIDEFFAEDK